MLNKRNLLIPAAAALMALTSLPGCFTGIESTPRITQADVDRRNSHSKTPEQMLLSEVRAEPFAAWTHGKKLYVTDSRIAVALTPSSAAAELTEGSVLDYRGMNPSLTVMGDSVADLLFLTPQGHTVTYRTEMTPADLRSRQEVFVPYTVEISLAESAASVMTGRRLWILTPHWHETDGSSIDRRKFVPVTVTGVTAGNAVFPLQVLFTDESGSTYAVYIAADTESRSGRTFHHTFSMTDPRKKYPAVSDDNWDNITRGKVAAEMTRDECRLALGAPDEIERNTGISNTSERWTYENGVYLIFENGLLTRFLQ